MTTRKPCRVVQRNCEAPSCTSVSVSSIIDESERDTLREKGAEDQGDEQQYDGQAFSEIQPVFVEEIQQQDTVSDHLSPSSLTPAMTADGGNADMFYALTGRPLVQM